MIFLHVAPVRIIFPCCNIIRASRDTEEWKLRCRKNGTKEFWVSNTTFLPALPPSDVTIFLFFSWTSHFLVVPIDSKMKNYYNTGSWSLKYWKLHSVCCQRFTHANLKISLYVLLIYIKMLPWKFHILNPKNSRIIHP